MWNHLYRGFKLPTNYERRRDEYNLNVKFENEKNGLMIMTYYEGPGEGHINRIKKLKIKIQNK